MYNRERIEEVIRECLKYYTMGDNKTDKEEKENFVESVMLELDNKQKGKYELQYNTTNRLNFDYWWISFIHVFRNENKRT